MLLLLPVLLYPPLLPPASLLVGILVGIVRTGRSQLVDVVEELELLLVLGVNTRFINSPKFEF